MGAPGAAERGVGGGKDVADLTFRFEVPQVPAGEPNPHRVPLNLLKLLRAEEQGRDSLAGIFSVFNSRSLMVGGHITVVLTQTHVSESKENCI